MLKELRNHSPTQPGTLLESLVFATPEGGPAPISPSSAEAGLKEQSVKEFMADASTLNRLRNTENLESLRPSDFIAVIVPGGHGPMFDLASNEKVGRFLEKCFYSPEGCLIVAVCHGVAALATMKKPGAGGEPFVKGRRLTCTSMQEENTEKWGEDLPFQVEERMKELGALLTFVPPHKSNVIVDEAGAGAEEGRGRLITGQNTESCREAVGKMIQIMESWKKA